MADELTFPALTDDVKRANVEIALGRLRHDNLDMAETDNLINLIHGYADELRVNVTDFGVSALELVSFRVVATQRRMAEVMREGVTSGLGRKRLKDLEDHERHLLSVFYALLVSND
jgi:hypothetical protein